MTRREEIMLQLGLDAKGVNNGLRKVETEMGDWGKRVVSKFNALLRVNVGMLAMQVFRDVLPTAQEFWDKFYGVDAEGTARFDTLRSRLRALRKELQETTANLLAAAQQSWYDALQDPDKAKMLDAQRNALNSQLSAQKTIAGVPLPRFTGEGEIQRLRDIASKPDYVFSGELTSGSIPNKEAEAARKRLSTVEQENKLYLDALEQRTKAETEISKIKTQILKLDKESAEVQKRIADAEKKVTADKNESAASEYRYRLALAQMKRSEIEQMMPSIGDLASSGYWTGRRSTSGLGSRNRFISGPFAETAQRIQDLEARAKNQFIYGDVAGAKASIAERNRLHDALSGSGIIPKRAELVQEAQIDAEKHLKAIREGKAKLLIKPELDD